MKLMEINKKKGKINKKNQIIVKFLNPQDLLEI